MFRVLNSISILGILGSVLLFTAESSAASLVSATDTKGMPARSMKFSTSEFTNSHVDVSPDGSTILFDLLGDLYTVPIEGGSAKRLTTGEAWNTRPSYSTDGKSVAYSSDATGTTSLWTMSSDGSNRRTYDFDLRRDEVPVSWPHWGPGGALFGTFRTSEGIEIRAVGKSAGHIAPMKVDARSAYWMANGVYSADGKSFYYGGSVLHKQSTNDRSVVELSNEDDYPNSQLFKLEVSRNEGKLAYYVKRNSDDTTSDHDLCELHIRDLSDGHSSLLHGNARECSIEGRGEYDFPDYAMTPNGSDIVMADEGKIVKVSSATGNRSIVPITVNVERDVAPRLAVLGRSASRALGGKANVIRWPNLSRDSSNATFVAFGKIYARDLATGDMRRLTTSENEFENSPAISPDGTRVAYATWTSDRLGHIMIVRLLDGRTERLTLTAGRYLNPAWSPDGSLVAFVADMDLKDKKGLRTTSRSSSMNLQIVPASGGDPRVVMTVGPIGLQTERYHPVPAFSSNGQEILVAASADPSSGLAPDVHLQSVKVDGSGLRTLYRVPAADQIVISPDGTKVAFVWRGGLYVLPIDPNLVNQNTPELLPTPDHLINSKAPVHVSWVDDNSLTWASENLIERYDLRERSTKTVAEVALERPGIVPDGCIAYINANVITMVNTAVLKKGTVVVCGERIVEVGPSNTTAIPNEAKTLDLQGATIVPGLIDTHAHSFLSDNEIWGKQDTVYVGNLAHGVTTYFDPATTAINAAAQAELIQVGDIVGPRLYWATAIRSTDWSVWDINSSFSRRLSNLDDAYDVVNAYTRYGAGLLKSYSLPERGARQLLATAARSVGAGVISHPNSYDDALSDVIDGVSLEHDVALGRNIKVHDDVLTFLAKSGVNYTRDQLGFEFYFKGIDIRDQKLRRLFPQSRLEAFHNSDPEPEMVLEGTGQSAKEVARIGDLGGLVTIGSHGRGLSGLSLHFEMWALVENGGMKPYEAIRAGTLNGAIKLGLQSELGSIEKGKLADFIVLNSDPLVDIRNTTDIRYISAGGFVYEGSSMTRLWPDHQALAPWPWQEDGTQQANPSVTSAMTLPNQARH